MNTDPAALTALAAAASFLSRKTEKRAIMKSEQIKDAIQQATDRLAASLREGHSELLRNYLQAVGRFHRYSWGNVLLIASRKPYATYVAGFHTWHKLGRFVRKGEKGILILAPILRRKSSIADEEQETERVCGFDCLVRH